jgi:hypothetical protein
MPAIRAAQDVTHAAMAALDKHEWPLDFDPWRMIEVEAEAKALEAAAVKLIHGYPADHCKNDIPEHIARKQQAARDKA